MKNYQSQFVAHGIYKAGAYCNTPTGNTETY